MVVSWMELLVRRQTRATDQDSLFTTSQLSQDSKRLEFTIQLHWKPIKQFQDIVNGSKATNQELPNMPHHMNTSLRISGDEQPSTETSQAALERYLKHDGAVADRLLQGTDANNVVARFGRIKNEVDALVAIIAQTPQSSGGQA
ncbi:hypothetical protein B0H66DRAFT_346167 [Apodospora peruviana]|uniref:Uncharacterized protein n=1 Tax=Apodospora peruviana TaxID=516989 RepID=A0AAE0HZ60_9PEZI|nr:hypothetical protein B0H66DRAFT_346167 [Apodospora peruviana]